MPNHMSNQLLCEKGVLLHLNAAQQLKLIIDLDEQTQEALSGGAKEQFDRRKPHVNVSNY